MYQLPGPVVFLFSGATWDAPILRGQAMNERLPYRDMRKLALLAHEKIGHKHLLTETDRLLRNSRHLISRTRELIRQTQHRLHFSLTEPVDRGPMTGVVRRRFCF